MKLRSWIILPLVCSRVLAAGDDLPKSAPGDALDFEPKLMLDGPHAAVVPASPTPAPEDRVRECQAALLQAEERAVDSEQLYKAGILAKVEMEARILRVVQARKALADAALAVAAAHAEAVKKSFDAHECSQADLDAASADLKTARQTADADSAEWDKAQLDAATLDLQRKRKLYSEGVGSRREVSMAEDRVVMLSGTGGKE
jgi:hypothetical protein